jgi:5-formyltetrahydrofolate cyclo-ligase
MQPIRLLSQVEVGKLKNELRKSIGHQLKSLASSQRDRQGNYLTKKLLKTEVYRKSKRISLYVDLPSEVPTLPIIQDIFSNPEKSCFLPKISESGDMKMLRIYSMDDYTSLPLVQHAKFALREPTLEYKGRPREEVFLNGVMLDLMIVPGVAFDSRGGRLGRGKGFYDRFIHKCEMECNNLKIPMPYLVSMAFSIQRVAEVPVDQWDRKIDQVIFFHDKEDTP